MGTAALFKEYFVYPFTRVLAIHFEIYHKELSQPSELPIFNKETVERHLAYLNEVKSAGVDGLLPVLLHRTAKTF